jgi:hypothetical protein
MLAMAIISRFLEVTFILSELWTPSWLAVCSLKSAMRLPPVVIIMVSTLNSIWFATTEEAREIVKDFNPFGFLVYVVRI